jgi:DNA-binding winged helix-turn-helix (wHTH) protein/TolB-like protein
MRFEEFDAELATGELRRSGVKVKIQDLPFRILAILLERRGEIVTRDELRDRLWGSETYVDAEAGLNTAIAKLREALGDRAEAPRFIETLPKRGYRFVGVPAPPAAPPSTAPPAPRRRGPRIALAVLSLGVLGILARQLLAPEERTTVGVVLFHNETGDQQFDRLAQQLTDGTVIALAANPRLAVIGNAAVLRTPRIFTDLEKIGAAVDADYLVLGQVQRPDGEILVRVHFVRVRDQTHLWATGIAATPAELDQKVARTVAVGVAAALAGRRE